MGIFYASHAFGLLKTKIGRTNMGLCKKTLECSTPDNIVGDFSACKKDNVFNFSSQDLHSTVLDSWRQKQYMMYSIYTQ